MAQIDTYLSKVVEVDGTDLHLSTGIAPKIRIHGKLVALKEAPIDSERLGKLIDEILDDRRRKIYRETNDVDLAYDLPGRARFRVICFRTRLGPAVVFRTIPMTIRSLKELQVPEHILRLTEIKNGLVLVTGPTGSGKSTTLAALIDHININSERHILTIEEPIEYVHKHKKSYVTQREVGEHCETFQSALRAATREDADVILVGELRDHDTISLAITAAEMGNLVFATLHTNSAAKTIDRIIDVFPEDRQNQIRLMLSVTLKGIVAQLLVPTVRMGRIPVNEILFGGMAVSNVIREGNIAKIDSIIESGKGVGMQTMDEALMQRYKARLISGDTAYLYAEQKARFESFLSQRA